MAKAQKVSITYVGSGNRTIASHVWDDSNDYVCQVPINLAANLITYPNPNQFTVTPGQSPSANIIKKLVEKTGVSEAELKALFGGSE